MVINTNAQRWASLLVFGGMLLCSLSVFAQKSKSEAKKGRQQTALMAEEKFSCCISGEESHEPKNADAAFMGVAASTDFGKLHEEPLPFTLENPRGNDISFSCTDGRQGKAYLIKSASPSDNYLVVIQEWWGLNDHIRKESEKYYDALGGKVNVIAVDLYDGKVAATVDSAQKYIGEALRSKRKETILQGAMDFAGSNAKIYTIGWCFGGMMSLQTAINGGDRVKGCVMYYGQPEKDDARIAMIKCDVLGIFGTQDRGIPNAVVDDFAAKMERAGKKFNLVRYDAVHAFANPSNPGYNKEFGEDAFLKSVSFLKEKMK